MRVLLWMGVSLVWGGCGPSSPDDGTPEPTDEPSLAPSPTAPPSTTDTPTPSPTPEPTTQGPTGTGYADVLLVDVSGSERSYTFDVTLLSPDLGCQQYADWWEVLSPRGELIYRRVLDHSHVDEQPFTRSGGPVSIAADETVIVRAHLNTLGYGGITLEGSPDSGIFTPIQLEPGFAQEVETLPPLPDDCAF